LVDKGALDRHGGACLLRPLLHAQGSRRAARFRLTERSVTAWARVNFPLVALLAASAAFSLYYALKVSEWSVMTDELLYAAASPVARISGSRWHLLTPRHHNFFFTAATLRDGLERAGFEVLESRHLASPYSLRYCVYKLATIMPRSRVLRYVARRANASPLGRVALPVNLGDVVTVLARKPSSGE
jgi:hypothetical protein